MPEYEWLPLTPRDAAGLLDGLAAPWWVAGGWAIDLFVGRTTRPHADMDIAVPRGSEPALRAHFADWDIRVAHDGAFEAWDGEPLTPPRHQFWARPSVDGPWALEFLLEDCDDTTWRFRRDPRVTRPLERFGRASGYGLPYVSPEVVLLYKAKGPGEPRAVEDVAVAAPLLDAEARRWLRTALDRAHPGHRWTELVQGVRSADP